MTDDPQRERIARLLDELDELPPDEREAAVAGLPEEDRNAVWEVELERSEEIVPEEYEDLGTGD